MPNYLKPQSPLYHKTEDTYFYPLTTADQVITATGERLNSLFKKTIKENIILSSSNWSETLPYTQTVTLNYSTDDYNVDANVIYDGINDIALNKAASCISYIKKELKKITFYCLKSKPEIDIGIEITATCRNTIATVEEGTKLNFKVVGYATEAELLADTPKENTIGIITTNNITGWLFSATEPESPTDGMVWISTGTFSPVEFNAMKKNGIQVYPISAKQYISGAWVDKTAKSYQGGKWVDWITYLFKEGSGYDSHPMTETYENNDIAVSSSGIIISGSHAKSIMTQDNVNFSGQHTLYVEATISYAGSTPEWHGALVAKSDEQMANAGSTWYRSNPAQSVARTKFTVNYARTKYALSVPDGAYHVGVAGNIHGTIHNIWLE